MVLYSFSFFTDSIFLPFNMYGHSMTTQNIVYSPYVFLLQHSCLVLYEKSSHPGQLVHTVQTSSERQYCDQ